MKMRWRLRNVYAVCIQENLKILEDILYWREKFVLVKFILVMKVCHFVYVHRDICQQQIIDVIAWFTYFDVSYYSQIVT